MGLASLVLAAWAMPIVKTTAFVLELAGRTDGPRAWVPVTARPVSTNDVAVPTRYGPVPARIYTPHGSAPTVVLFPGIHGGGVDEPRFARLSSRLAATGVRVIAVPLPDLRQFRVTSRSTDMIEDVTAWAAGDREAVPGRRVGLVGVSFAGGLALVASGRASLQQHLSAVVSIGGHGDIRRTLQYLTDGQLPDGSRRPPHDYGLAVAALAAAPHLLQPPVQRAFADALRTYLEASLDASPEQATFQRLRTEARAAALQLPDAERRVLLAITDRDVAAAGPWVQPAIPALAADRGLSPEASPATMAPVFLLHGVDDNVIPSTETGLVARYLRAQGNRRVTALLTPFVSHADLTTAFTWGDAWRFVGFWREARDAMEAGG